LNKLLGNTGKGLLFVVSAPAGTGKTTLTHLLCEEFLCVVESISYTTRTPRPGEIDGKHYFFVSQEQFQKMAAQGDFLEHANVFGDLYGTSKRYVVSQQEAGKHVVLVIDTQGALQLKKKIPAVLIFIKPPSLDALKERLKHRKTETAQAIEKRLSWAEKEMGLATEYDYEIVNDDLMTAYAALRSILIAEEHKLRR